MRSWGRGFIFAWSGAIVDIPATYQLCDGTNGTPDLRDRFIVGAGDTYNIDDTGGSDAHTHPFTSDGHNHDFDFVTGLAIAANYDLTTSTDPATGTTDGASDLPLYYSLAYVMQTG